MGPTDYKPRQNNYRPLKEREQKNDREAPQKEVTGQQINQSVEQQREEEQRRGAVSRILQRAPGGPDAGDMVTHHNWATAQARANNEALEARQSKEIDQNRDEAAPGRQRTPVKDLVKQSAERTPEIPDPSLERKGPEIER